MLEDKSKILDLRSRRPLADVLDEKQKEEKRIEEVEREIREQERALTRTCYTETADALRRIVDTDDIEGVIVIAKHKSTGLFFNDITFGAEGCSPKDAFAWVGILDTIKAEMIDVALMAPTIMSDGSIVSPEISEINIEMDDDE